MSLSAEDLALPLVRLYLDDGPFDAVAKKVLCRLSGDFFGQLAFMAKNASQGGTERSSLTPIYWASTLRLAGSSDWRQHGLPPGRFPAVAAASSSAFNASKFAFLDMPAKQSEERICRKARTIDALLQWASTWSLAMYQFRHVPHVTSRWMRQSWILSCRLLHCHLP
eukprot:g25147.t1